MSVTAKRIAVVIFLISLAFIPSMFAELSSVDDLDMYKWLIGSEPSFKDLFLPHASGGAYYRPLIGVSYLFDKYVWFLDTRLMHMDNILFHLFNALLVYYLAYQLLPRLERQSSNIPLVSSLLFGLHPLTTESVAWISGRTDIMADTFVLLSTVFLLRFRNNGNKNNLIYATAILIPGLLIKETPLAFLLGALFILSARKENSIDTNQVPRALDCEIVRCVFIAAAAAVMLIVSYSVWPVFICGLAYLCYEAIRDRKVNNSFPLLTLFIVTVGIALPIGLFFLIRSVVFTSSISSVGRTLKLILGDLNYSFQTFFGAVGFYVRKFFFPFPLNFAIREIDPMYNFLGVLIFFLCLYAIRRRSMNSALFLSGVCLFLPALPLSLGTITWTAYAERYIYMSTAFWALSVSLWTGRIEMKGSGRIADVSTTLIIIAMGVCTFQRCILWRTNLGLLCDTVTKSPGFKLIRGDYMVALIGCGDLEGAKIQYRASQTIPSVGYMEVFDINMAAIHTMEGKYDEADKLYNKVLKKTDGKSVVAYGAYISFLKNLYATARAKNDGSDSKVGQKLVENMEKLYRLNKDPSLLYRSGQLSIALGRCDDALRLFSEAGKVFPAQSEFARISTRLAYSLSSGHCR